MDRTYSISLDEADLALLPLHTHSESDFSKKEYFHFQVMETETVKEAKPIIFYTCHICAIEVPAAFASEHIASIKHEANARIASEAAQRTRSLISALAPPSDKQLNARFCAHCSTIISRNHYKTKKHRVAVLQDKMLKALMALYIGDDDDDGNVNITDISDHTNEDLIKEKSDENNEDTEGHDSLEIKSSKDSETCKKHEKIQSATVEDNDQVIDNDINVIEIKKMDFNSVDDDIINNKIIDIEFGNIEIYNRLQYSIETCNKIRENMECRARNTQVAAGTGKTTEVNLEYDDFVPHINKLLKVSSDHYHSFVGEGGKMRCVVCNATFLCKEALSRAFSLRHLLPKTMSMFDEQDVTKINDIYSHCNICNNLLKNDKLYDHVVTSHHQMNKVKKASSGTLSQTIANANVDEKRGIVEKVETVSLNTHNNRKDQATNKGKVKNIYKYRKLTEEVFHNNTLEKKVNNAAGSSEVEYKHLGEVFGNNTLEEIIKNTAGNSKDICKIFEEVFENDTPKDKVQNTNKTSGAKKLKLGNSGRTLGYPFEVTDEEKVVNCVICDCKVPNVKETKELHLTGNRHVTNAKTKDIKKVTHRTPYEITERGKTVRCTICNCYVPNTAKNRKEHFLGPKHAANVDTKRSIVDCTTSA